MKAEVQIYANPLTGEIQTAREIKLAAAESAGRLIDTVFAEVGKDYGVADIPALKITEKQVNAALTIVVQEHVRTLIDAYKPQQLTLELGDDDA